MPLNDIHYLKYFPKYDGTKGTSTEEHIGCFNDFNDNIFVDNYDVYMRLFSQYLDKDVRKWFKDLSVSLIGTIEKLENTFMRKWGVRWDNLYYMTTFSAIKNKILENVVEFTTRFNNMYYIILGDIIPKKPAARDTYAGVFQYDFAIMLRERRPSCLLIM